MALKSPQEILQSVEDLGVSKGTASLRKLVLLSFLAGIFLSTGGLISAIGASRQYETAVDGSVVVVSHFSHYFTYAALFPIGLILIFCCGAELFTGNNLYLLVPFLSKKISIKQVLYNWGVVWVGNFIGSIFAIFVFARFTGIVSDGSSTAAFIADLAEFKVGLSPVEIFFRGIGSNFLICAGSWFAVGAGDMISKAFAIWLPAMTFVFVGFEHSIANMFSVPLGWIVDADFSFWEIFVQIILTTIGNVVGGCCLVALVYYYSLGPIQPIKKDLELADPKDVPEEVEVEV
ncbi:hypothetical protein P9112_004896 [Eukaryota sp. TZLM1-RC]